MHFPEQSLDKGIGGCKKTCCQIQPYSTAAVHHISTAATKRCMLPRLELPHFTARMQAAEALNTKAGRQRAACRCTWRHAGRLPGAGPLPVCLDGYCRVSLYCGCIQEVACWIDVEVLLSGIEGLATSGFSTLCLPPCQVFGRQGIVRQLCHWRMLVCSALQLLSVHRFVCMGRVSFVPLHLHRSCISIRQSPTNFRSCAGRQVTYIGYHDMARWLIVW